MKFIFREFGRRDGFTLIEVMIATAIIAVLSMIVIPNYLEYRVHAQRDACISNMKEILNAEELYYMRYNRYAASIADLCNGELGNRFIRKEPKCPCGGTYTFIEPTASKSSYVTCMGGSYTEGYAHELESSGSGAVGN